VCREEQLGRRVSKIIYMDFSNIFEEWNCEFVENMLWPQLFFLDWNGNGEKMYIFSLILRGINSFCVGLLVITNDSPCKRHRAAEKGPELNLFLHFDFPHYKSQSTIYVGFMYGGEPPYGQHQSPSGGHTSHQLAGGGYGYAAPQQPQQANYGYAPAAVPAPAPVAVAYGGAPSAYGGYDPAYGTNNPGMGGAEPVGGYGGRPWAAGHTDVGRGDGATVGGGRGGGGSGGPRFAAVRLRGLPFGVREYEVAMFLVGN